MKRGAAAGRWNIPGNEDTLRRRLAIVVFLNGAEDASRSYVVLDDPRLRNVGYPLQAERGPLVAFRASVLHEVTPVTRGERHTVVAWLVQGSA